MANDLFNNLNTEQRTLLGKELTGVLTDVTKALSKLMLHDAPTDTTVTAIDGKPFSPDVYIKVIPVDGIEKKAVFAVAAEEAEKTGLKDKELVALYDISMFRGDMEIQPDGRVQVKIKIPDSLKNRTGLDVIHIGDTVTVMNAVREGDYLVFVTDHFSEYGVIAKNECLLGVCRALGLYKAASGICYCWILAVILLTLLILTGFVVFKRKKGK